MFLGLVNFNDGTQRDLKYMAKVICTWLVWNITGSIKNLKKGMYEMVNSSPLFIFRLALNAIVFPNSPNTYKNGALARLGTWVHSDSVCRVCSECALSVQRASLPVYICTGLSAHIHISILNGLSENLTKWFANHVTMGNVLGILVHHNIKSPLEPIKEFTKKGR